MVPRPRCWPRRTPGSARTPWRASTPPGRRTRWERTRTSGPRGTPPWGCPGSRDRAARARRTRSRRLPALNVSRVVLGVEARHVRHLHHDVDDVLHRVPARLQALVPVIHIGVVRLLPGIEHGLAVALGLV